MSDATIPKMEAVRSAARARAVTRMLARARSRVRAPRATPSTEIGRAVWNLHAPRGDSVKLGRLATPGATRGRVRAVQRRARNAPVARRETRDGARARRIPPPHRARDPVARPRRRHLLVPGERGTCRHRRRTRPASACTHTERRRAGGDPTSGAMGFFSFLMSFMAAKKTKVRARRPRRSLAPHPTAAVFFAARNVPRPTDPRPSSPDTPARR